MCVQRRLALCSCQKRTLLRPVVNSPIRTARPGSPGGDVRLSGAENPARVTALDQRPLPPRNGREGQLHRPCPCVQKRRVRSEENPARRHALDRHP